MQTIKEAALEKVRTGETSLKEFARVFSTENKKTAAKPAAKQPTTAEAKK